jgi:hypothetical protein
MNRGTWLLLFTLALAGVARAQIYTWVDGDGVRHFSDVAASRHAKPAHLPGLQRVGTGNGRKQAQTQQPVRARLATGATPIAFPKPDIIRPKDGATIRDNQGTVPVALTLAGRSQLPSGEQITYYLDGRPIPKSPTKLTSLKLTGVNRGTHHLRAALLYHGHEVRRSPPLTFYMRRPTAISPLNAGQGGGRPTAQNPLGAPVVPPAGNVAGAPAAPRFVTTSTKAGTAPK